MPKNPKIIIEGVPINDPTMVQMEKVPMPMLI
jgi:hypothetical protein